MNGHVLAIDQGTTSSRAMIFDRNLRIVGSAQEEFPQHFPHDGWVEHDPEDLWRSVISVAQRAIRDTNLAPADIASIGITNQRETVLVWDRNTGKPVHNAIVWQDRRTSAFCHGLRDAGHEGFVSEHSGLLLDPYFSASKLCWILDSIEGLRARAERGEVLFGTVDSFLIWRLTDGRSHVTDATNASRTMLYDIRRGCWSEDLCKLFNIPLSMLPSVHDCAADFGYADAEFFGRDIPILGVAGDQQAAMIGQACFEPGMLKATYGTGCFALLNTGTSAIRSQNRLLSTIAYQLDGETTFALEGSIFVAGAVVQWLRDGLNIIERAEETQRLAENADPEQSVILVPAFVGLAAPYWVPECRGAIFGLTRNTGPEEFARAALESVGFQSQDLIEAMRADWPAASKNILRVDGGMAASDWAMQFLADITALQVDRPGTIETTATGVAWLAGMRAGIYPARDEFAKGWAAARRFEPKMIGDLRAGRLGAWKRAIDSVMGMAR